MKTKTNPAMGGGASASKKLLAAVAVLAVAFVVLAAVPAVADDSDAATGTTANVATCDKLIEAIGTEGDNAKVTEIILTDDIVIDADNQGIDVLKNVTVDLAGHTISKNGSSKNTVRIFCVGGTSDGATGYTMKIASSIDGGKLIGKSATGATDVKSGSAVVLVNDNSKLVIDKIEIQSEYYGVSAWSNSKIESNGATIKAEKNSAIGINGSGSIGASSTINGGTYTSKEAPAIFWSNTSKVSIFDATIGGAGGLDIRNGCAVLNKVTIRLDGTATNEVGASGPASFNVGIGIYQWANSTSYGVPNVVIKDVTIAAADSVQKDCDVYFGSLIGGTSDTPNDFATATAVTMSTGNTRSDASFAIMTNDDKALYTIDTQYDNASSVKIDLTSNAGKLVVMKSSVLNCNITVVDETASFENIEAKENIAISKGSIVIDGDYTTSGDNSRIVIRGNAKISGTVESGVTLVVEEDVLAVIDSELIVNGKLLVSTNGTLINNGTLDVSGTAENRGVIVSNDGKSTKVATVTGSGTFVGEYTEGTETKKGTGVVSVSTVEDLYYSLANGVKKVSLKLNASSATSLELDCDKGTKYGVEVTVDVGTNVTLKVTGKISGDLVIIGDGAITFIDTTTVNNGVVLTLSKDAALGEEAVFNLYGAITGYKNSLSTAVTVAKVTVTVGDKAAFKAFSGAQIGQTVTIAGAGKIDLSQAQGPQTVGEDISADKTYGQLENVTIVGNLTIKNNSTVRILGGFQVDEGVTLTIEKGSKLLIESSAASMIVNGRIIVEEGADLIVSKAKDVSVSGSIESEGTVAIYSNVTVKSGGEILINDGDGSSFTAGEQLTIESGASLIIKAKVGSDTTTSSNTIVSNKGTVALNGAVLGGTFTIKMMADGAVADIQSVSGNKLVTISDAGLKFTKDDPVVDVNTIKFTPEANATVKGLTVVEKVSSYVYEGTTYYTNTMDVAGSVSVASETVADPAAAVKVSGKNLAVTGTLALGKKVKLNIADAESVLKVSGTVTATETDAEIASAGTIDVTGLVQTVKKIDSGINAAMYETKSGTTPIYNYSTPKAAVDSGAKDITVTGTVYVSETLTVPAGVTVKNNGTIVVGSDDSTDVSLTFADEASVKYGIVEVMGTLVFDNKKDNKANEIRSDVSVIGDVSAKYTNLYTALSEAQAGDTVTITRDGTVEIKKNLTIKDGVTLDVPNSKRIKIADGVTLTVAGTLKTAEPVEAQTAFAEKASVRESTSAIVVTGTFMSMAAVEYSDYVIAGAYYSLTDSVGAYNYVTTLENAAKVAASATGGDVEINGKVSAGDIAFTGTSSQTVYVYVMPGAVLTVASITLDEAVLITDRSAAAVGVFSGRIVVGDSAVDAKNVAVFAGADDDGQMAVYVAKTLDGAITTSNDSDSTFSVSTGKVFVEFAYIKVTVASGATLVSYDGYDSEILGDLQIDGTVSVGSGETISVDGNVIVNGVLSVADETDTENAGVFAVDGVMYIGVTKKATTGEAVSVSGPVVVSDYVIAAVGADISESTIDSFKNADGKLVSTTYVVEDKDWIVVYDLAGTTKIGVIKKAPVENAEFDGKWKNSKDADANDKTVGASGYEKVRAVINYSIYTIQITSCAGIESIAIDGNLLDIEALHNGLEVKAGSHTITYSLMNGYSGDAKLSLVSSGDKTDASVSGMSFTVSGDKGVVKLQLTGIEKSGYVDPSPDMPAAEKDDGLTITDYLLIVLVVLIVIMAVIVAMRLMRS